jgi:hypothetical protein
VHYYCLLLLLLLQAMVPTGMLQLPLWQQFESS